MAKKPYKPNFSIDETITGQEGVQLIPQGRTVAHPRLIEKTEPFSYEEYARSIHMPHPLWHVDLSPLQNEYTRCLDMPIRLAGDTEYWLPKEWAGLAPLIENLIAQEHATNKNWKDYNTYITVDCSWVEADQQQRHGGLHVDGFQGERIEQKTKISRNYVMTTNGGTRFYPQRFVVADTTKYNVFQGFDIQAERYEIAEENVAYFMDAYCVHESGIAERSGMRTFLRVTYDLKEFDRKGNTHNPLLNYNWDMVTRTVHDTLWEPDYVALTESPNYPAETATTKTVNRDPFLIGLSGKPGSAKNLFLFQIQQELKNQGYSVHNTALANVLHEEAALIIDNVKAGKTLPDFVPAQYTTEILELAAGDTGEKNPVYNAYNRRNENVRKILNLLGGEIHQGAEGGLYLMNRMLRNAPDVDFVIFSDLRFPEEAEFVKNNGVTIRCEINEHWVASTANRVVPDGFKYSAEALNHPTETALDVWDGFFAHVKYKWTRPISFTHALMRNHGFKVLKNEWFTAYPQ